MTNELRTALDELRTATANCLTKLQLHRVGQLRICGAGGLELEITWVAAGGLTVAWKPAAAHLRGYSARCRAAALSAAEPCVIKTKACASLNLGRFSSRPAMAIPSDSEPGPDHP